MELKLPPSILSAQDLKSAILDLQRYAQWFSQASIKKRVTKLSSPEEPLISEATAGLIKDWAALQPISSKSLDELISSLKDFEATALQITVTLAAPAPNSLKQELVSWFREHIDQRALINVAFNATILGGMVVSYGSHVYDWSFKRQILAARESFPEVLRNV